MRGVLVSAPIIMSFPRIIPADAGSTCQPEYRSGAPWDHPRGCREHQEPNDDQTGYEGSSPLMRGAPVGFRPLHPNHGIIPADAGTCGRHFRHQDQWDHPRGCGEHQVWFRFK